MDKKTFEITFTVKYEVAESAMLQYEDENGETATSFEEALAVDIQSALEYPSDFWGVIQFDKDPFTVTGRILNPVRYPSRNPRASQLAK